MESINVFNSIRYRITPSRNNFGRNTMDDVSKYSVSWTNIAGDNIYADMHRHVVHVYPTDLTPQGHIMHLIRFCVEQPCFVDCELHQRFRVHDRDQA